LDVDRLLNSLCIVTKTKYLNKLHLEKKDLQKTTIISIANATKENSLHIDGKFHGALIIRKGAEVTIQEKSKIESFKSVQGGEAKIHYKTAKMAKFDPDAMIGQDSERITKEDSGDTDGTELIVLRGKGGGKQFSASIENATLITDFNFIADEDLKLQIHDDCNITIKGAFTSDGSIRIFNVTDLSGDISEVEILADAFKENFTKTKVPGVDGYNTFTVGFKKQAINVIANVIDARNYLYLWIYAHHKVIYYANFLIPVLAKELFPPETTDSFPNWSLDFDNIKYLDDAYIWTTIRYVFATKKWKKNAKDNEITALLNELFSRKYKKSLYKSLAEYDLFFEKYDQNTKNRLKEYIAAHLIDTGAAAKPWLTETDQNKKEKLLVGYFKKNPIEEINKKIGETVENAHSLDPELPAVYHDLKLTQLVFVSVDYKSKQLETLKNFIDMKDDIVPISQVPLLETQTRKTISNGINTYFYLYYQTNSGENMPEKESDFVKRAVKKFFDELVGTKIKNKK